MVNLLDFISAITDLRVWLTVIIIVFIVVLVIYIIASISLSGDVLVSSAVDDNTSPVEADQIYYLPTADIQIIATAKVSVATDSSGEIQSGTLLSLQLENKVVIGPDTTKLYRLQYRPSLFANDELRINTNATGLLETVTSTTTDTLPDIIASLSSAPANILAPGAKKMMLQDSGPQPVGPVKVQTVEFTNTFIITADELVSKNGTNTTNTTITRPWIISIDGTQRKPVTVNASFTISLPKRETKHHSGETKGILTRPLRKVKLQVQVNDKQFNNLFPQMYELLLPDVDTLINVPVTRTAFVKKVHAPRFVNGLVVENFIDKPSEANGFVSIPINILKAIFSLPAQLLSFRIYHLGKEKELEEAKQALAAAKAATTAQQEAAQQKLQEAAKALQQSGDQLQQTADGINSNLNQKDADKSQQDEIVSGEVLIEAIKAHASEWKAKFHVLDICVGKKKVNGVETNINALVFKPVEKLEHGEAAFIPVPAFIPFTDSKGRPHKLPTDVQRTGGRIESAFTANPNEACDINNPKRPGCSVSRLKNNDTGTIGLKVFKNGKSYVLSCYHVLCSSELLKRKFVFDPATPAGGDSTIISPGLKDNGTANDKIGVVVEGSLNEFMDCAIAEINNDLDVHRRICRTDQGPAGTLEIGMQHVDARVRVFMSGRTSKLTRAHIKSPYTSTDIEYSIGKITLSGLIATSPLAEGGDSGAVVFDEDSNVVGIVVARSPSDTYIIPIAPILTKFQVKLKP